MYECLLKVAWKRSVMWNLIILIQSNEFSAVIACFFFRRGNSCGTKLWKLCNKSQVRKKHAACITVILENVRFSYCCTHHVRCCSVIDFQMTCLNTNADHKPTCNKRRKLLSERRRYFEPFPLCSISVNQFGDCMMMC